ncbi:DUF2877 domain-containing protein [Leucobacter viscericola]|uniref:DUF2877 domain-containing protein n=1 Tax=Leucobacter viscericola TaxID=2714935 RepID=A0A6G7XBH9_9MICO|nr:DUF2877 domain-containing protein [Leucobacter viscericola]QIK61960.1 DUF2877 domain-containing protein [Leucobacter viscericola]
MPLLNKEAKRHERALSRGHAVPEGTFTGVVHSVFAHSCNLAVAGTLLTLQDSANLHSPTSIRIAGHAGRRWQPSVAPGQPVWLADGLIRIGGSGESTYTLDISGAEVWRPHHALQFATLNTATTVQLRRVVHEHPVGGGNRPDLCAAVDALRKILAQNATCSATSDELATAVGALIGLGPGLTPSGDDLLVGLLATLARSGGTYARDVANEVAAVIATRGEATTDVSRHYLQLATEGKFSQPLTELLDALTRPDLVDLQSTCIQHVLAVGATSGADAIAGIVLGLSVLAADESNVSTKEKAQ